MNIHEILQRIGAYLAVGGAFVAAEGVLANCFLMLPLGASMMSALTMGDHLSTASAHLPFLIIGGLLGTEIGRYTNDTPIAQDIRRGPKSWNLWLLGIMTGLTVIAGLVLQNYVAVAWGATFYGVLGIIILGRRHIADFDPTTRRVVSGVLIVTVILCGHATMRGLAALEQELASVTISTDGNSQKGIMVGIYDRGSLFLLKPSNKLLFVSQRTNLVMEEIQESLPDHTRRDAITTWVRRQLGRGN